MRKREICHDEQGFIKFTLVVLILVFFVYLGIKFGMPYYKHSAFRSDVRELTRISLGDTDKLRAQIFERALELNLPLEERDIQVTRKDRTVRVRTAWEDTVDILGYYEKTLKFVVDVEE